MMAHLNLSQSPLQLVARSHQFRVGRVLALKRIARVALQFGQLTHGSVVLVCACGRKNEGRDGKSGRKWGQYMT